jgi:hypothetical protein
MTLLRRGYLLEYATLAWNVVGIVVLAFAALAARSGALAGFGLASLIEIGASTVVIWELSGTGEARRRQALSLIGVAFAALATYLLVQSTVVLIIGFRPGRSPAGIAWTALTAAVMFALATGKSRTGAALDNPVLRTEGGVTLIDGLLATAVLLGLLLNALVNSRRARGRGRRRARLERVQPGRAPSTIASGLPTWPGSPGHDGRTYG